ncbi:MAG: branched-chain amino acid transporter permease, partial [Rhizobacter sp.]|nr:branched-chain amino acid transporter permease [Rhizobacter sp.]
PLLAQAAGQPYYVTFMSRVLIFGMAALSLNLLLGFGGLTSLGHSAFLGLGAYTVGLMVQAGVSNGFLHIAALLAVGTLAAFAIGALCLRTSGLSFIMLTLAFAQLLYFVGSGLKAYGGDDGFSFRGRSQFGSAFSLADDTTLYYAILACLLVSALVVSRLVDSRFGMALRGTKSNLRRIESIGLHAYRYQLTAFVISGVMCTVAGGLLANLTQFVSPAYMHWARSADLLIMALLGGMGSVLGPVVGAAALLLLEEGLGALTQHWQAPLGIILILIVMFARNGLSEMGEVFMRAARRLLGTRLESTPHPLVRPVAGPAAE